MGWGTSGGGEAEIKGFKGSQDTHCLILIFFPGTDFDRSDAQAREKGEGRD